ncbi:MAG TPA: mevalonate kinase [Candidatus Thermoplasmatota archaeon]|nr:mevalonate kinase [Candidatus Thermoplasmatota archaeon]
MAEASAPGKAILLGEHAVVFGEPAIAVALDLRTRVHVEGRGTSVMVNGEPLREQLRVPHVHQALALTGEPWGPLDLRIASDVPRSANLGSSAALSVALVGALRAHKGLPVQPREVARLAFEVELGVQEGRASPTDTTTSVAGGGVLVDTRGGEGLLWDFERGGTHWFLHKLAVPAMTLVVGYTGTRAPTGAMVGRVGDLARRDAAAMATVRELGQLARDGAAALRAQDLASLGTLMDRAHAGLQRLGVSTPLLDRLCEAARPHSLGAKLTGAGGGGSMIALTTEPAKTVDAIKAAGGEPLIARVAARGLEVAP